VRCPCAEINVKYLRHREIEDRGIQPEAVSVHPSNGIRLRLSSRNQLEPVRLCWKRPDCEPWGRVVYEQPGFGLLHNAEEDGKRMLDYPTHRLLTGEDPGRHSALDLDRKIRAWPGPLPVPLQEGAIHVDARVF